MKEEILQNKVYNQAFYLIDNWLDFLTFSDELPGLAIGIFVEDEIIFKKEYGYANLEKKTKLTDQHLFRIASQSKLFTATAIMKLYHEGKLSLDDKITKFLPWFTSKNDANLQDIRISHLLTHTSGITADGNTGHWVNFEFPDLQQIKKQVTKGISYFKTSEIHKYSNFGFALLGQVIEAITKLSYHDYIKKEILEPLEMNNTFTDINDSNEARHAKGYGLRYPGIKREELQHASAKAMCPATGFSSNVEDMIKFYQAHFMGNDILFPDAIKREMQRVHYKGNGFDRGIGFEFFQKPGFQLAGHAGGYHGFATISGFLQEKKMIVVVLTNAIDGPSYSIATGLISTLLYFLQNIDNNSATTKKLPDFEKIIGFYNSIWGVGLMTQLGSKLATLNPKTGDPVKALVILEHKDGYKFTIPKSPNMASTGQDVEFIEGQDGEMILVDNQGGKRYRYQFSY